MGFAVTNGINRAEHDKLRAELTRLRASSDGEDGRQPQPSPASEDDASIPNLTEEQLKNAIARADANTDDAKLQQMSGQALYVYVREKGNAAILPDVVRILRRAHALESKNITTTTMLGDALYLLTQTTGETSHLAEARKFYQEALAQDPTQAYIHTSLGLTYFYDRPSDPRSAIREYRKALAREPRHEASLRALVAALIETGEFAESEKRLKELETANPSSPELPNLRAQLEQKRNEAKEQK